MKQVLIIHGGNSFNSYTSYINDLKSSPVDLNRSKYAQRWFNYGISQSLTDFDVFVPSMPNRQNAVYDEWKIVFEKLLSNLNSKVQIVGHSLGAMFLAKYFEEVTLERKVPKIVLISGAYNDDSNEELGSFEVHSATGLANNSEEIHLFHSKDDFVVPFTELAKFQADLPTATVHTFDDRGHFLQPDFPELYELIKQE